MATLIPSLVKLRSEFNLINPNRDKRSDGWIGDPAHAARESDHNPDSRGLVHAIDVDKTGPWDGVSFDALVKRVLATERKKWRDPNDKCRLSYVIWNGYLYDKDNDFQPVKYSGDNPHTEHAHFSGRSERSCEQDTRPYGVYLPPPPPKEWDEMATQAEVVAAVKAGVEAVLNDPQRFPGRVGERIHDRDGWAEMSLRTQVAYLFEGVMGLSTAFREFVTYEKTEDALESGADQARAEALARLELALARVEAFVTPTDTPV